MPRWLSSRHWKLTARLSSQREYLALLLWPYLPEEQRLQDNNKGLRHVVNMVSTIESGFATELDAPEVWERAHVDPVVRSAAEDLRTLRLQLDGKADVSATPVAAIPKASLGKARKKLRDDAVRSEVNWQLASALFPVVSALLLLSGWFYTHSFLGRFGVAIERYFGLSDYLAASIQGLLPAVVGSVIALVAYYATRGRTRLVKLQFMLGRYLRHHLESLGAMSVIALVLVQQMGNQSSIQTAMIYIAVLAIVSQVVPWISIWSNKPTRDELLVMFLGFYCALLWYIGETNYRSVTNTRFPPLTEIRLANAPGQTLNWRVIAGNSLYLFLLNDEQEVVIVPVEQVLSIRHRTRD